MFLCCPIRGKLLLIVEAKYCHFAVLLLLSIKWYFCMIFEPLCLDAVPPAWSGKLNPKSAGATYF